MGEMLTLFTVLMRPFIETNPLPRGGPLYPQARIDTVLLFVDVNAALAGWMHRVCADLAGCYETSDYWMVRLRWFVV